MDSKRGADTPSGRIPTETGVDILETNFAPETYSLEEIKNTLIRLQQKKAQLESEVNAYNQQFRNLHTQTDQLKTGRQHLIVEWQRGTFERGQKTKQLTQELHTEKEQLAQLREHHRNTLSVLEDELQTIKEDNRKKRESGAAQQAKIPIQKETTFSRVLNFFRGHSQSKEPSNKVDEFDKEDSETEKIKERALSNLQTEHIIEEDLNVNRIANVQKRLDTFEQEEQIFDQKNNAFLAKSQKIDLELTAIGEKKGSVSSQLQKAADKIDRLTNELAYRERPKNAYRELPPIPNQEERLPQLLVDIEKSRKDILETIKIHTWEKDYQTFVTNLERLDEHHDKYGEDYWEEIRQLVYRNMGNRTLHNLYRTHFFLNGYFSDTPDEKIQNLRKTINERVSWLNTIFNHAEITLSSQLNLFEVIPEKLKMDDNIVGTLLLAPSMTKIPEVREKIQNRLRDERTDRFGFVIDIFGIGVKMQLRNKTIDSKNRVVVVNPSDWSN